MVRTWPSAPREGSPRHTAQAARAQGTPGRFPGAAQVPREILSSPLALDEERGAWASRAWSRLRVTDPHGSRSPRCPALPDTRGDGQTLQPLPSLRMGHVSLLASGGSPSSPQHPKPGTMKRPRERNATEWENPTGLQPSVRAVQLLAAAK